MSGIVRSVRPCVNAAYAAWGCDTATRARHSTSDIFFGKTV